IVDLSSTGSLRFAHTERRGEPGSSVIRVVMIRDGGTNGAGRPVFLDPVRLASHVAVRYVGIWEVEVPYRHEIIPLVKVGRYGLPAWERDSDLIESTKISFRPVILASFEIVQGGERMPLPIGHIQLINHLHREGEGPPVTNRRVIGNRCATTYAVG